MSGLNGLVMIVPSSIVVASGTGSIADSGLITFSGATSLSINDCFSSTYDCYMMQLYYDTTINEPNILGRMRGSGTDSSTGYVRQAFLSDDTSQSGSRVSGSYGWIGRTGSTGKGLDIVYVFSPYLALATVVRNVNSSAQSGSVYRDNVFTHSPTTSYDGITIYPESSDMNGTLAIYGFNQ